MKRTCVCMLWCALALAGSARAATGIAVPEFAAYDQEVQAFMARWNVPGAAVALARNGKLLFARGYGVANPGTGTPVQPDSMFRIASDSKPITATAVMKLVEDGALQLDMPVLPYLARGTPTDARGNRITVRHLLEHTGGWDRDVVGDPMFKSTLIAQAMGVASPPDSDTILRWMLTQPLQADPGTKYAYSNFGFMVLGLVVAKASGQTYDNYVRTMMLRAGITRLQLGHSLARDRSPSEVAYLMPAGSALASSVFTSAPGLVNYPDGAFALEPLGAAGAWVTTAIDLVAFAAALDGNGVRPDLLNAASMAEMTRRPAYAAANSTSWYAKGWLVNSVGNWWHQGSLPGTTSLIVRTANGFQWAVVLNYRPSENQDAFGADVDDMMWRAYNAVRSVPTADQFAAVQSAGPIAGCYGQPAFAAATLCLPVVEVPGGTPAPARYTATLQLADAATLTFNLLSATPVSSVETGVPAFDPVAGIVNIPRVVLPDPSGTPRWYRARMQLLPGPGLSFRVIDASPL